VNASLLGILLDVRREFGDATKKFGPFNSAHEGFAILKEEVDELWDEVKAKQGARDLAKMRKEAIQVAAMAIRFVHDICDGGREQV
jgi:NTP pyrophosphatase (non-canonical NTP hydrolase)